MRFPSFVSSIPQRRPLCYFVCLFVCCYIQLKNMRTNYVLSESQINLITLNCIILLTILILKFKLGNILNFYLIKFVLFCNSHSFFSSTVHIVTLHDLEFGCFGSYNANWLCWFYIYGYGHVIPPDHEKNKKRCSKTTKGKSAQRTKFCIVQFALYFKELDLFFYDDVFNIQIWF